MSDAPLKDPRPLTDRLIEAGESWADLDAAASLLEETKKTRLAQISKEQGDVSVAKAEMLALASPQYMDHLTEMVEARRRANRARVRYDSGKAYVDLARSAESTRRAEMTLR